MRFKLFKMINTPIGDYHMFLGESKKRQYIMTFDKNDHVSGFKKFRKEKEGEYFLQYDLEELLNCSCNDCMKKLEKMKKI